ncbi:hypothetical protein QE152_g35862 [Popillia japonica]|uniref:Uncharacterized protein n=1 Tax=Popillia japonica TaxID=7064 RepID=A0AAW1IEQ0_POPJA
MKVTGLKKITIEDLRTGLKAQEGLNLMEIRNQLEVACNSKRGTEKWEAWGKRNTSVTCWQFEYVPTIEIPETRNEKIEDKEQRNKEIQHRETRSVEIQYVEQRNEDIEHHEARNEEIENIERDESINDVEGEEVGNKEIENEETGNEETESIRQESFNEAEDISPESELDDGAKDTSETDSTYQPKGGIGVNQDYQCRRSERIQAKKEHRVNFVTYQEPERREKQFQEKTKTSG